MRITPRPSTDTAARRTGARIPMREPSGPLGGFARLVLRRMFGETPDMLVATWNQPQVFWSTLWWEAGIARWRRLSPELQALATMAVAGQIGCAWCIDFGSFEAHGRGLDVARLRRVPEWRHTDGVFSEQERDVLAYAEELTATPPVVDEARIVRLRDALGARAFTELTMLVGVENQRSRFNLAVGLTSQGYTDRCAVPSL